MRQINESRATEPRPSTHPCPPEGAKRPLRRGFECLRKLPHRIRWPSHPRRCSVRSGSRVHGDGLRLRAQLAVHVHALHRLEVGEVVEQRHAEVIGRVVLVLAPHDRAEVAGLVGARQVEVGLHLEGGGHGARVGERQRHGLRRVAALVVAHEVGQVAAGREVLHAVLPPLHLEGARHDLLGHLALELKEDGLARRPWGSRE
mmetsp:Transcript_24364/g.68437  ORF Transcript_24364/g.68437 Transcript_24364/m.68437 type:complete len:202 (+) Transcript_24364:39-644(+)